MTAHRTGYHHRFRFARFELFIRRCGGGDKIVDVALYNFNAGAFPGIGNLDSRSNRFAGFDFHPPSLSTTDIMWQISIDVDSSLNKKKQANYI